MPYAAMNSPMPHERASRQHFQQQMNFFSEGSVSKKLLDSIPSLLAVLNRQRQIVYANEALCELIGAHNSGLEEGLRPGEALDCVYAGDGDGGCGTGEACRSCGAAQSIFASLHGRDETRECSLCRQVDGREESLDLRVRSVPWEHSGEQFTLFSITDISHEKRRRALERVFFHDVLNIAGSVKGYAELLRDYDLEDRNEIAGMLHDAMQQVVDEIEAQRLLAAAENRELETVPQPLNSRLLLEKMIKSYSGHELIADCELCLASGAESFNFASDPRLLSRVLGNLIKNALEASSPGDKVTLDCRREGETVQFRVHNPGCIPAEEQLQIFRRSFSTKGRDRGLGTYSIRLLSEYLGGEVSFTSTEQQGTTFTACYPLSPA